MDEELMTEVDSLEVDDTLSVEDVEVADPQDTEDSNVPEEGTQNEQEQVQQSVDMNSIYASIRRKAEADAREKQAKIDTEFVSMFGDRINPKTGAPIRSAMEYLQAVRDQEQLENEIKLKESGLDPDLINKAVANNPVVRHAQELIQITEQQKLYTQINNDVAELGNSIVLSNR